MAVLLHAALEDKFTNCSKILTFLKRMPGSAANERGRYVNIMIISMKLIANLALFGAFLITLVQEDHMPMIVKGFVTLCFVYTVDVIFTRDFPAALAENAARLSRSGKFSMGTDRNTTIKILRRFNNEAALKDWSFYASIVADLIVNLWWCVVIHL